MTEPSLIQGATPASTAPATAPGHTPALTDGGERVSFPRTDPPAHPLDQVRLGRMIANGVVELTLQDLGALLVCAITPAININQPTTAADLLARALWTDLATADVDIARQAFATAQALDGANWASIFHLAELTANPTKENTP